MGGKMRKEAKRRQPKGTILVSTDMQHHRNPQQINGLCFEPMGQDRGVAQRK